MCPIFQCSMFTVIDSSHLFWTLSAISGISQNISIIRWEVGVDGWGFHCFYAIKNTLSILKCTNLIRLLLWMLRISSNVNQLFTVKNVHRNLIGIHPFFNKKKTRIRSQNRIYCICYQIHRTKKLFDRFFRFYCSRRKNNIKTREPVVSRKIQNKSTQKSRYCCYSRFLMIICVHNRHWLDSSYAYQVIPMGPTINLSDILLFAVLCEACLDLL